MNPIGSFFVANTFSVFFVYGLAYFVMGLVITIEARRAKDSPFAMSLWPLAIFGFLHSLVEWNDMLLLVPPSVSGISGSPVLQGTKVILLGVSTFFLILFGANTIYAVLQKRRWLRTLPYVLLVLWVLSPVALPHMISVTSHSAADTVNSCLVCHSPEAQLGIIHLGSWFPTASVAEVWARYLLYFPGCVLTAVAWWLRAREMQERNLRLISRDCRIASFAFGFNTLFAGVIVSPAPYFPASVLNYSTFTSLVGIQPQVFRALMATVIAVIVVRVLRIFEVDRQSQLRQIRQQRLQTEIESRAKVSAAYEEISALQSVIDVAGRSLHLKESMASVLSKVLETMSLQAGAIFTWEPGSRGRYIFQQQGFDPEAWQALLASDPELDLLCPRDAEGQEETIFLTEAGDHPLAAVLPTDRELCSLACAPLRNKDASVGALMVASLGDRVLTPRDHSLLTSIAQHVIVALDNARLYENAQHSLEIQAMLTQEMNHRVKNNLQIIADILTLQLRRQDQTTDEALANSINRIKAMAVVHDLLAYQSETSISVKAVIDELAKSITQHATGKRIHFTVQGPELSLPLKQATSLSLSLNELITNAVKHGFAGRERGEIGITISLNDNQAHFAISDDGVGLPSEFNLSRNSRLGLRIVEGLVTRELKGAVSFEDRQGTTAIITFPCSESELEMAPVPQTTA